MKKILLASFLFLSAFIGISYAASRGTPESDPFQVLEAVKEQSNEDYKIQETALDQITDET